LDEKENAFGEGSLTTYLPFGSMSYGIFKSPYIRGEMDIYKEKNYELSMVIFCV
jgi:hypothetical protein